MITDFDDAYTNGAYIEDAHLYPARWAQSARDFREQLPKGCSVYRDVAYGESSRQKLDLFRPAGTAHGLVMFVHGGYWMKFAKEDWSHLASGAVQRGWAVAMPGYTLAPNASLTEMGREIAMAIHHAAATVAGPIALVGHSAGGHLVTRQISTGSTLAPSVLRRIAHVVSISGVHDLRPLMKTKMNATLHLQEDEAVRESPALQQPVVSVPVTCWVGADERPEFIRQSQLLANIWTGSGLEASYWPSKNKHHFNVIDDLCEPDSELLRLLAP